MFDSHRLGRIAWCAAFALAIGVLSQAPAYHPLEPQQALLRLTLNHAGQRLGACRQRTAEELARRASNMRDTEVCPRERASVRVSIQLDGATIVDRIVPPRGIARDGASTLYHRMPVPAGTHRLRVAIADGPDPERFSHVREESVELAAGRILSIDFDARVSRVTFR